MPSLDVIRTLTLRAKADGYLDAQKQVRALGDEYQSSAAKQLSVDKSLQSLQRRYDQEFRAQQDLAKVAKTLDLARAQGLITQQRQNDLMVAAIKYHNQAADAGQKHGVVLQELAQSASASASSLGTLGSVLVRLGPIGIAVAATLAALGVAMGVAAQQALELADAAGKLRDLADTTGFTTEQLQALQKTAAQVGVSGEQLGTGLERFASSMDDIKNRTGGAFQALLQIDRQAAIDISNAKNQAEAWDILAKALANADVTSRNLATRGIFGRNVGISRVLLSTADAGGLNQVIAQMRQLDLLTDEQIKHWDDLGDAINENLRQTKQNLVSTFAGPTLEALNAITGTMRELSNVIQTTDFNKVLHFFQTWGVLLPVIGPPLFAITNALKIIQQFQGKVPELPTGPAAPGSLLPPERTMVQAEQGFKDLQAEVNAWRDAVIKAANDNQRLSAAMQGQQTPAEQLANKISLVRKAQAEGSITAEQSAEAQKRLNAEFKADAAKRNADALSGVATETEKLQGKINDLSEEVRRGNISWEAANRAITGAINEEDIAKMERQVSALGEGATASEKFAAGVARLKDQLAKETITQDTFNRKVLELVPGFENLSQNIGNFFNTFVQGMIEGKSATDALAASLKQLGASITQAAFKNVGADISKSISNAIGPSISSSLGLAGTAIGGLAGPLGAAAVGVGISLLGSLFDNSKENAEAAARAQEEQARWAKLAQQYQDNVTKATQAALDLQKAAAPAAGEFASALEDINQSFSDLVTAEQALGATADSLVGTLTAATNQLRRNIEDSLQRGINEATGKGFLNQAADLVKQFADAFNTLSATAGGITPQDADLLNQFISTSVQSLIDANQLTGSAFQDLLKVVPQAVGRVHEFDAAISDLSDTVKRSADELADQAADLNIRILQATSDQTTLEGQLAVLDAEQQREREAEVKAGGENLVLLESAQFAERAKLINDFNAEQIQQQQDLLDQLQSQINDAAKNIADYLQQLKVGPESALSPSAQLAAAQSAYQNVLALAQGGDVGAAGQITQFAEDFRKAAQAFYGSGSGYQMVLSQIMQELEALPQVQGSSDPVVAALLDVKGAVNENTVETQATTAAVIDVSALTVAANEILGSSNAVAASTNEFILSINSLIAQLVSINQSINSSIGVETSTLQTLQNLTSVMGADMGIIRHNSTWMTNNTFWSGFYAGGAGTKSGMNFGEFAMGGVIRGGIANRDSVTILGMPGEFVVRKSVAQNYSGELATLNATGEWPSVGGAGDMVMEIRRLAVMLRQLIALQSAANDKIDNNTAATISQTSSLNRESRLAARKSKAA